MLGRTPNKVPTRKERSADDSSCSPPVWALHQNSLTCHITLTIREVAVSALHPQPNPSAQQVACIALSEGEMRNPLPQMTSAGPALLRRIARLPTLQQILTINAATTCHQYET